jgi:hypothetical protein
MVDLDKSIPPDIHLSHLYSQTRRAGSQHAANLCFKRQTYGSSHNNDEKRLGRHVTDAPDNVRYDIGKREFGGYTCLALLNPVSGVARFFNGKVSFACFRKDLR